MEPDGRRRLARGHRTRRVGRHGDAAKHRHGGERDVHRRERVVLDLRRAHRRRREPAVALRARAVQGRRGASPLRRARGRGRCASPKPAPAPRSATTARSATRDRRGRRLPPRGREGLHLGRRPRPHREHPPRRARAHARRAVGHQGPVDLSRARSSCSRADGTLGERNGVVVAGIEEKMGIHGSPTCTLALGAKTAVRRLPHGRRRPGHGDHVPDDERGPDRRRHPGSRRRGRGVQLRARVRQGADPGHRHRGHEGCRRAAHPDRAAPRRAPHADDAARARRDDALAPLHRRPPRRPRIADDGPSRGASTCAACSSS